MAPSHHPADLPKRLRYMVALRIGQCPISNQLLAFCDLLEPAERKAQIRPRGQDHGPFDNVLQLPYVPRPIVMPQDFHDLWRNLRDVAVHLARELADEVLYQKRNIFGTLSERRKGDGEHVQPVVQVGSEAALLYHLE